MTAAAELYTLLGCACSGLLIGLLYDILSLFRFPFHSVIADAVFDAIFYLLVLGVSGAALFIFSSGVIRFYALGGIVGGVFLYMRFPSRLFRFLARKTFKIIHK